MPGTVAACCTTMWKPGFSAIAAPMVRPIAVSAWLVSSPRKSSPGPWRMKVMSLSATAAKMSSVTSRLPSACPSRSVAIRAVSIPSAMRCVRVSTLSVSLSAQITLNPACSRTATVDTIRSSIPRIEITGCGDTMAGSICALLAAWAIITLTPSADGSLCHAGRHPSRVGKHRKAARKVSTTYPNGEEGFGSGRRPGRRNL